MNECSKAILKTALKMFWSICSEWDLYVRSSLTSGYPRICM